VSKPLVGTPAATAVTGAPSQGRSRRGLYLRLAAVGITLLLVLLAVELRVLLRPRRPTAAASPAGPAAPVPTTVLGRPTTEPTAHAAPSPIVAAAPPASAAAAPSLVAAPPATLGRPALPSPRAATPRPTQPSAAPSIARTVTAPPPPSASSASAPVAAAATILAQADRAAAARDYDEAVRLYDQALLLDPRSGEAAAGRQRANRARDLARRSFVVGATSVETPGSADRGPSGFESADVKVTKTPKFSGRIEFDVSPRPPMPGEAYKVGIFLTNTGSKDFRIASLSVTETVNGAPATRTPPSMARDVPPGKRVQVAEISDVWKEGTTQWSLAAEVTAPGGESFRSQLSWR
jgi:hypothetical protein